MRCTVCGCDILPNSICCQNCGTRVIEMTGVNSAQPRYGNSFNNSFNNGFDNGLNSNVRAVGKNMSIGKKVLILLLALFVGAAIVLDIGTITMFQLIPLERRTLALNCQGQLKRKPQ